MREMRGAGQGFNHVPSKDLASARIRSEARPLCEPILDGSHSRGRIGFRLIHNICSEMEPCQSGPRTSDVLSSVLGQDGIRKMPCGESYAAMQHRSSQETGHLERPHVSLERIAGHMGRGEMEEKKAMGRT